MKDYFFDPEKGHSELDGRIQYCSPYHLHQMTEQIQKLIGKSFNENYSHQAFKRKPIDVSSEILNLIQPFCS